MILADRAYAELRARILDVRLQPGQIVHELGLAASIEAQEAALVTDDVDSWGRADRRFHELLREAAGNRRLRETIHRYDGQLQRARVATLHLRAKPRRSTDDHQAILAAIKARDEDEAVRVHHAHRRRADAEMLAAIQTYVES